MPTATPRVMLAPGQASPAPPTLPHCHPGLGTTGQSCCLEPPGTCTTTDEAGRSGDAHRTDEAGVVPAEAQRLQEPVTGIDLEVAATAFGAKHLLVIWGDRAAWGRSRAGGRGCPQAGSSSRFWTRLCSWAWLQAGSMLGPFAPLRWGRGSWSRCPKPPSPPFLAAALSGLCSATFPGCFAALGFDVGTYTITMATCWCWHCPGPSSPSLSSRNGVGTGTGMATSQLCWEPHDAQAGAVPPRLPPPGGMGGGGAAHTLLAIGRHPHARAVPLSQ